MEFTVTEHGVFNFDTDECSYLCKPLLNISAFYFLVNTGGQNQFAEGEQVKEMTSIPVNFIALYQRVSRPLRSV